MPSYTKLDTTVNVLGSDQQMRFGRVVDIADDGLFVDLFCPNRRREFITFGNVFFSRPTILQQLGKFYVAERKIIPGELLMPETPVRPWIWVPGEIHWAGKRRPMCQAAIVHWQDSGAQCTDIIPLQRIRLVQDVEGAVVPDDEIPRGSFVKRSVELGEEFPSLSTGVAQALIKRLNGRLSHSTPVFVVDILDGHLQYICQIGDEDTYPWVIDEFIEKVRSVAKDFPDEAVPPIEDGFAQLELPTELWQEVFSNLDTVKQTQLRAVCAMWKQILDGPALCSTIVIGNEQYSHKFTWESDNFLCLASVNKCLRPDTQRIVITHLGENEWWSMHYAKEVFDLIRYVAAQQTGIRLRTLHLRGVVLGNLISRCLVDTNVGQMGVNWFLPGPALDTRSADSDLEFIVACRNLPCNTIHMTNCEVILGNLLTHREEDQFQTFVTINIGTAQLPLGDGFDCAFRDALEASLPELSSDQQRLKHSAIEGAALKTAVCKILTAAQSGDPRPSSHYRGKEWNLDAEGLQDLQWEKLSRITRRLLVELQTSTRETDFRCCFGPEHFDSL